MDADKIKNFFIFHVEKMILVVVLGVAGFLAYSGFNKEPITKKHDPKRLVTQANEVKASVDDIRTDAIVDPRKPTFDINREITIRTQPVEGEKYPVETWEPKPGDLFDGVKRRDPELLAALDVRAQGVFAPMAVLRPTEEYAIKILEPAEPLEVEVVVEKKKKAPRRSRANMMGGEGGGEMEMMEEMMEGMEEEMGGMEGMDGGGMDMAGMTGAGRKMDLEDVEGFRPTVKVTNSKGVERYSVPYKGSFIAGTAVVPYKQLHENYENTFRDAEGFNPMRDRPLFLGYELQRADVTDKPVGELVEEDWVDRYGSEKMPILAALFWAGFNKELVSQEYREDGLLTMWIPPVMMSDYSSFCLHPRIPMKSAAEMQREAAILAAEKQREEEAEAMSDFNKFKVNKNGAAAGGAYGGAGMYGGDDMMMEGGGEDTGGMGGGMYGGGAAAGMLDKNPVDYKLIRFYDFQNPPSGLGDKSPPKENRKYVYRVRYSLNDPNFPEEPELQPEPKSLDGDTYTRVRALLTKTARTKVRAFELKTEWSKPCEAVSLVSSSKAFAGPVKPGTKKRVTFANRDVTYVLDSPKAEMVVQNFSELYSTDVAMLIKEVGEGTVLAAKAEFGDVVDPITLEVKKAPDLAVTTSTTVISILGGEELSIVKEEDTELRIPGAILLFDENGGLRVHEEAVDQQRFRAKSFAKERGK